MKSRTPLQSNFSPVQMQRRAAEAGGLSSLATPPAQTIVSPREAAIYFETDPSTIRRWPQRGCPVIRKGARGPGNAMLMDLAEVAAWRGRANGPAGLTANEVLQRIAAALRDALAIDHADIRAGISREDAAAVLIVVFERCCKAFGHQYAFDRLPSAICALMREL